MPGKAPMLVMEMHMEESYEHELLERKCVGFVVVAVVVFAGTKSSDVCRLYKEGRLLFVLPRRDMRRAARSLEPNDFEVSNLPVAAVGNVAVVVVRREELFLFC